MNTPTLVKNVKKGEYVRFKNSDTAPVWIKGHYDASSKSYSFHRFDDVNSEMFRKAKCTCFVGFTY